MTKERTTFVVGIRLEHPAEISTDSLRSVVRRALEEALSGSEQVRLDNLDFIFTEVDTPDSRTSYIQEEEFQKKVRRRFTVVGDDDEP
jgi:hypothetical protein